MQSNFHILQFILGPNSFSRTSGTWTIQRPILGTWWETKFQSPGRIQSPNARRIRSKVPKTFLRHPWAKMESPPKHRPELPFKNSTRIVRLLEANTKLRLSKTSRTNYHEICPNLDSTNVPEKTGPILEVEEHSFLRYLKVKKKNIFCSFNLFVFFAHMNSFLQNFQLALLLQYLTLNLLQ